MWRLVGTDGNRFYTFDLNPGSHIIGRKGEIDIIVPDTTVSRRHAEIEVDAGGSQVFLTDLKSHNGTLVNGERITDRVEIHGDDKIMFGQTEFRLTTAEESSGMPGRPTRTKLSEHDPQNSVYLSIEDALRPLPSQNSEQADLLPVIFDMAKMLVLPEPQEVMLERSLGMIAKIIPAERLAVLFVSDDTDEVYTAATLLPGGKDPGAFTLSQTIVKEIITNKNAILIGNAREDPRFAEQKSIIMSEMKSALAVPLFDEGRVLGILYADTTSPLHRYSDEHMRLMATCGNIIASRLLNYELLNERQEKQIMDAELKRAADIQMNLLVECPSEIPGYQFCALQEQSRAVGGDLYDVKQLPGGQVLFMVADVSGKGMGAALLMSNILASFRILYDTEQLQLAELVRRVSLQVFYNSAPENFATLFIGITDPDSGRINYVNAGHNPPYVVRANGNIEELPPGGVMIGAFDFADWTEGSTELDEGDLLFIFSDGVTEAERDDLQYGEDKLMQFLIRSRDDSAHEITGRLIDDINGFMGDAPRTDDITMLAIKRISL